MKKVTLLLTLLLAFSLLFSACAKDDYVQKYLSNEGEYALERIWAPRITFSSFWDHQEDYDRIQRELEPFQELNFRYAETITLDIYEEISIGTYGVSIGEDAPLIAIQKDWTAHKYVLSLYYTDGTAGYVLVDLDGTVYYVNNKDYRLMKTKSGTVDPSNFRGYYY